MQTERTKNSLARGIRYRVYKLNLLTELLTDQNFIANFSRMVHQLAKKPDIYIIENNKKHLPKKIREVTFYDTANYDLYRQGFILRQRSDDQTATADVHKKSELTLKFRHADKAMAANINLSAQAVKSKVKFKKQILNTELNKTKSLYSHSVTVTFSPLFLQQGISGLSQIFPMLAELSIDPKAELHQVNQMNIEESMIDLCQMRFYKNTVVHAVMIVWQNYATKTPLAVEFELRAKLEKPGKLSKKTKELLKVYYQSLQIAAHAWLKHGTTKTSLIYGSK